MNKKGQVMLGAMIMTIVGIIVAITIYAGSIVPTVGEITTTAGIVNRTYSTSGSVIYLEAKRVSNLVLETLEIALSNL